MSLRQTDMNLLPILKTLRRAFANLGDALFSIWELLGGAATSILTGRLAPNLPVETTTRDALIICPSPLLNQQTINWERRSEYTIAFVNSACLSPTYLTMKPERFFLIDPIFFQATKHALSLTAVSDKVEQIAEKIASSTDWPMTVFVPWHYRKSAYAQRLADNLNITVCGIPVFNARGRNRMLTHLGFRIGILNPVYQNVLIAAIFYSLKAGHQRVLIWGGHHTWLKEVEVDQQNRVLHSVQHSDAQLEGQPLLNADGSPRLYHTYLQQLSTVFEQYHVLQDLAQRNGNKIINATEESFIDAFDRTQSIPIFTLNSNVESHSK